MLRVNRNEICFISFKNLFKISHPQIIASLLARSNFFVNLMKFKVIGRPLIPGTALTVISNFF